MEGKKEIQQRLTRYIMCYSFTQLEMVQSCNSLGIPLNAVSFWVCQRDFLRFDAIDDACGKSDGKDATVASILLLLYW